jgi:endogenous inhibitor of DNA gyrase (YacG/DUF329 family)
MSAARVRCPTCKRELVWSEEFPWRPFCSERCKMVDLGAWFAEERAIAGEPRDALDKDDEDSSRGS